MIYHSDQMFDQHRFPDQLSFDSSPVYSNFPNNVQSLSRSQPGADEYHYQDHGIYNTMSINTTSAQKSYGVGGFGYPVMQSRQTDLEAYYDHGAPAQYAYQQYPSFGTCYYCQSSQCSCGNHSR
ncbi:hypothetical protein C8J56DRAFT_1168276 [Mycena floridula]|nr:hypothetical protein C8J56DRAFT_1168276 [Mycena floridula]